MLLFEIVLGIIIDDVYALCNNSTLNKDYPGDVEVYEKLLIGSNENKLMKFQNFV